MLDRIMGVITLKVPIYRQIADDQNGTQQALIIVIITTLVQGLFRGLVQTTGSGGASLSIVGGIINAFIVLVVGLIGWAFTAFVLSIIASALGGKTNTGEMLRVTGYVNVFSLVSVLNIVALISPALLCITGLISLAVGILSIIGYTIGVREAAEFSTGKAIVTAIAAAIVNFIIVVLIGGAIFAAIAAALALAGAH